MKKFLAAAVLTGIAALGFAQDAPTLKFTGYLNTGLAVHANGEDPAPFGLYGNDAGKSGGRFNLDGVYANGDTGLKFEFRSENPLGGSVSANAGNGVPTLKYGFAYANLFDKMVTVNAGIVRDTTWNTTGDAAYKPVDSEPGVQIIAKPVAGLTVGTFLNSPQTAVDGAKNAPRLTGSNYFQDAGIDVVGSYMMDKSFSVVGGVKSYPTTKATYTTVTLPADKNTKNGLLEYYFSASVLAVPGLTAILEAKGMAVNDYDYSGKTEVVQTLAYNLKDAGLDPVTAGLIAYEWMYGSKQFAIDDTALNLSYKVNPYVAYKLDGVTTFKFGGSYLSGKEASVVSVGSAPNDTYSDNKLAVTGTGPASYEGGDKNKAAMFQIKPQVTFVLSPSLTVTAFYAYTASAGAKDSKVFFLKDGAGVAGASEKESMHSFDVDFLFKY